MTPRDIAEGLIPLLNQRYASIDAEVIALAAINEAVRECVGRSSGIPWDQKTTLSVADRAIYKIDRDRDEGDLDHHTTRYCTYDFNSLRQVDGRDLTQKFFQNTVSWNYVPVLSNFSTPLFWYIDSKNDIEYLVILPKPKDSGKEITIYSTFYPPKITGLDERIRTPCDYWQAVKYFALSRLHSSLGEKNDAMMYMAKFEQQLAEANAARSEQGPRPAKVNATGYIFGT